MNIDLLTRLLNTTSISGYEADAATLYRDTLRDVAHGLCTDALNNTYAFVGPDDAPLTVMIEAHIDEVGFQVLYIDSQGRIYLRKNGGIDPCCVPGRFVSIRTLSGESITGVIGKQPIHLLSADERTKVPELSDLWVDTGLSADEVRQRIHVGDPVCYLPMQARLGTSRLASKALDDKIGVFVVMEALRAIAPLQLPVRVCGVASTQEEVGCRGAAVEVARVQPDYAISIDVDFATDVPQGSPAKNGVVNLGDGVVITRHLDSHRDFSDLAVSVAEEHHIAHQISARRNATGGTNAARIQLSGAGVKTLLLGIPNRYMHTPVEMVDLNDVQSAIDLIVNLVQRLHR